MIVFLTVGYIVLLLLLVKFKVITLNLWWKLSPVIWMVALLIVLFIPLQFWAPGGSSVVIQYSVPIVPNVAGQVIEVPVKANVDLKKGDILFKIDPTPYQAARDQVAAKLKLAESRLKQTQLLRASDAVSLYELEQYQAEAEQLQAALVSAEYNLEQTVVKAPADGFVTNLALREGARVTTIPLAASLSFVENSERLVGTQIMQGHLRNIAPGQTAEVTFKLFPGKVFKANVDYVVRASATGQISPSGNMLAAKNISAAPYAVRLKLEDEALMNSLPAGAVGSAAIYTDEGAPIHIIRKVMIRMDAFVNYVNPL